MNKLLPGLVLFLLALPLAGCHRNQAPLREAVRQYRLFLAEGYQGQDMSKLGFVATKEQSQRVYLHMAALGEGRTKMEARLLTGDWLAVAETPAGAQVQAREEWAYAYVDLDSGKTISANTVEYTLRYHLQKTNQQWLVAGVDIIASKNGKDYEPPPFLQRPADKPIATQREKNR